jgi:hypothetical protein
MAVPVVIFNTQEGEDGDDTDGEEKDPMDLNDFVANASGDVSFEIIDTSGWVAPANYDLDGSMLTLSVADGFEPAAPAEAEDAVIRIEATDNGDSAVLHVRVRGNINPAGSGTLTDFTIGTQEAAADDSDEPDYFDSEDAIGDRVTCATFNICTIDLIDAETDREGATAPPDIFMDGNIRDSLTFHVFEDSDLVDAVATDAGVMITGLKAGTATVIVWATDEAGMPMLAEEDDTDTADIDETKRPADSAAYVITVTVDGAPFMSESAVGTKSITVADPTNASDAVVGTVFDDNDNTLGDTNLTFEPGIGDQGGDPGGIASINWEGQADTTSEPSRREISVDGLNPGTVTLTVKVTETEADNNPTQYTTHMITVAVTP